MQNYSNALISIIVPCYNEEGNVELLYNKVKDTLHDTKLEFIFVDEFDLIAVYLMRFFINEFM